ncbi:hypothetical protein KQI82_13700 [Oscillibacter sp. MSJ-2]|uniref:AB hydrolase-1 domain-containing protein n=1 Tax=Dysosmobacter acutus TaxID=2841504 RepID=A0ABS6FCH4_9FIRM|nr:alpha/beta fold hydrolase [Dysosmobacter acutus]MBU5627961.1 hypothetical protein [Dysosmobacter acutus]
MGEKVLGTIYLPDSIEEGEKLPCVIPCSGITGLNALYPALIARLLTKSGYACLGFDYRGWGPSEGKPGYTTYCGEYEDIVASYVFARQQPEIDGNNISLFGWGMAAPICIRVAADIPQIKSVACGNGYYNGERMLRVSLSRTEMEERLKKAEEERVKRALTGTGEMTNIYNFSTPAEDSGARSGYFEDTLSITRELTDVLEKCYGEGGKNYPPAHSWHFFDQTLRLDAEEYVKKVAPRGLFIAGSVRDAAYSYYESECIYKAAGEGRVLYTVDGTHNDWMFDDHPEFLKFGDALVRFYDAYMK